VKDVATSELSVVLSIHKSELGERIRICTHGDNGGPSAPNDGIKC
jgi:hypothetical protein